MRDKDMAVACLRGGVTSWQTNRPRSSRISPDSVLRSCLRSRLASATTCGTSHASTQSGLYPLKHKQRKHAYIATSTHLGHPALRPGLPAAAQGLLDGAVPADVKGRADEPDGVLFLDVSRPDSGPWVHCAPLSITHVQDNPPAHGRSVRMRATLSSNCYALREPASVP